MNREQSLRAVGHMYTDYRLLYNFEQAPQFSLCLNAIETDNLMNFTKMEKSELHAEDHRQNQDDEYYEDHQI